MGLPGETVGPVKFAKIDATGAGANELVTAVTGKKIRVLSLFMACHVACTVNLQDDTATPVKIFGGTAQIHLSLDGTAGGPSFVLPYSPKGWCETSSGKALDVAITGVGGSVAGGLTYVEVS